MKTLTFLTVLLLALNVSAQVPETSNADKYAEMKAFFEVIKSSNQAAMVYHQNVGEQRDGRVEALKYWTVGMVVKISNTAVIIQSEGGREQINSNSWISYKNPITYIPFDVIIKISINNPNEILMNSIK